MATTLPRTLFVLAVLGTATLGLSACGTDQDPSSSTNPPTTPSATPTQTPTPTTAPTEEPSATPTPTETPTNSPEPVGLSCDQLITPQALYDFNSNYAPDDDYRPKSGSAAASIVSFDGVACSWVNQTSGEVLNVAAAKASESVLNDQENKTEATSTEVGNFGDDGYFTTSGDFGIATVFTDDYWLVAESDAFLEAGDAQQIVESALTALN